MFGLIKSILFINPVHHYHPALLHRHTLILDRLLTFSTLVLELSFSRGLSLNTHLFLPHPDLPEFYHLRLVVLAVAGGVTLACAAD